MSFFDVLIENGKKDGIVKNVVGELL